MIDSSFARPNYQRLFAASNIAHFCRLVIAMMHHNEYLVIGSVANWKELTVDWKKPTRWLDYRQ